MLRISKNERWQEARFRRLLGGGLPGSSDSVGQHGGAERRQILLPVLSCVRVVIGWFAYAFSPSRSVDLLSPGYTVSGLSFVLSLGVQLSRRYLSLCYVIKT